MANIKRYHKKVERAGSIVTKQARATTISEIVDPAAGSRLKALMLIQFILALRSSELFKLKNTMFESIKYDKEAGAFIINMEGFKLKQNKLRRISARCSCHDFPKICLHQLIPEAKQFCEGISGYRERVKEFLVGATTHSVGVGHVHHMFQLNIPHEFTMALGRWLTTSMPNYHNKAQSWSSSCRFKNYCPYTLPQFMKHVGNSSGEECARRHWPVPPITLHDNTDSDHAVCHADFGSADINDACDSDSDSDKYDQAKENPSQ